MGGSALLTVVMVVMMGVMFVGMAAGEHDRQCEGGYSEAGGRLGEVLGEGFGAEDDERDTAEDRHDLEG